MQILGHATYNIMCSRYITDSILYITIYHIHSPIQGIFHYPSVRQLKLIFVLFIIYYYISVFAYFMNISLLFNVEIRFIEYMFYLYRDGQLYW